MAKKRNTVDVKLEGTEGNVTVTGGSVIRVVSTPGALPPINIPGGEAERSDVSLEAKNTKKDVTVAGGHVVESISVPPLAELTALLTDAYRTDPQARGGIIALSKELAEEAQLPPNARDVSRAHRLLDRLQQFILRASFDIATQGMAQILADAIGRQLLP